MNFMQFDSYRIGLEVKEASLGISIRKERPELEVASFPDPLDVALLHTAQEKSAPQVLANDVELLLEVRAALQRMEDNCYGACLDCEREVDANLLRAKPWAAVCILCGRGRAQAERAKTMALVPATKAATA